MANLDDALSTKEAADFLGVSRFRVHQFIRSGRLSARKFGNQLVLRLSELRDFKAEPRPNGRPKKS